VKGEQARQAGQAGQVKGSRDGGASTWSNKSLPDAIFIGQCPKKATEDVLPGQNQAIWRLGHGRWGRGLCFTLQLTASLERVREFC